MKYLLLLLILSTLSGCVCYEGTNLPVLAANNNNYYKSQLDQAIFRSNQAYYKSQIKK
jgi:hypothetical protein